MKVFFLCNLTRVLIYFVYSLIKKSIIYFITPQKYSSDPNFDQLTRPIHDELSISNLNISKGKIPEDLNGYYVRNGPNPHFQPRGNIHIFDGDGMLHSVQIEDGFATYKNKWVRTEKFLVEEKEKRTITFGLNEAFSPVPTILSLVDRYWYGIEIKDQMPSNTSVVFHANKLLSLHEAQLPFEMDIETLNTKQKMDFQGKWTDAFTAHPKIDPDNGEMHFFSYDIMKSSVNYGVMDKDGKLTKNITLMIPHPTMIHDFVMTKNYVIFNVSSLMFRKENIVYGKPFFEFDHNVPSYFGILPKSSIDGKDAKWFETLPSTTFHFSNGYEYGSEITIHGCRMSEFKFEEIEAEPHLYEWKFDLVNHKVSEKPVSHLFSDFPVINPKFLGKKYQYVFSVSQSVKSIIKSDLENRSHKELSFGETKYAVGEFLFVPKKKFKTEDDGYLMSFVHDLSSNQSSFLIVDAQSFQLICEIDIPRRVPIGFHGTWIDVKPKTKFEQLIEKQIEEVKSREGTPTKKVEFKKEDQTPKKEPSPKKQEILGSEETPKKEETTKNQEAPIIEITPPPKESPKKELFVITEKDQVTTETPKKEENKDTPMKEDTQNKPNESEELEKKDEDSQEEKKKQESEEEGTEEEYEDEEEQIPQKNEENKDDSENDENETKEKIELED